MDDRRQFIHLGWTVWSHCNRSPPFFSWVKEISKMATYENICGCFWGFLVAKIIYFKIILNRHISQVGS
jgi:hypothetical protein